MVAYIQQQNLCDDINKTTNPVATMNGFISILQEGLVNSWRETMYENLAGRTHLSKLGLGAGVMFIANTYPVAFPTISAQISTWRNNYLDNEAQRLVDAKIIAHGVTDPHEKFTPGIMGVEAYGKYLEALLGLYDKEGNSLLVSTRTDAQGNVLTDQDGKDGYLTLTYTGGSNIADVIDIRSSLNNTVLHNIKVSDDGKSLIIGDVGQIAGYTQGNGTGKRAYLVIGNNVSDYTCRLNSSRLTTNHLASAKDPLQKPMTFTKKETAISAPAINESNMTSVEWKETASKEFTNFFEFGEGSTLQKANKEIDKLQSALMNLENTNSAAYSTFLSASSHIID